LPPELESKTRTVTKYCFTGTRKSRGDDLKRGLYAGLPQPVSVKSRLPGENRV